jgi:hypothetical protein
MNSHSSILSCSNIFQKYSLEFVTDLKDNDKLIILDSIKSFKDINYKKTSVSLFEGREINILSEFFSRYGELIRYIYILYFIICKYLIFFYFNFHFQT